MKKTVTAMALCAVFCLSACGNATLRAEEIQKTYAAQSGYQAQAIVSIPRAEETLCYTLAVEASGEETEVSVLAPETIAGITARVQNDTLALCYDGWVLDAGTVSEQVSAVNAVPFVMHAIAEGYLCSCGTERIDGQNCLCPCYSTQRGDDTFFVTVAFDASGAPLAAEIVQEETVLSAVQFTAFTFANGESAPGIE